VLSRDKKENKNEDLKLKYANKNNILTAVNDIIQTKTKMYGFIFEKIKNQILKNCFACA
ncbi:MAG: hypothetical protein ACI90V_010826, partial [Bacillariaceae sp.]|jgi:hypothetical protein